MFDGRMLVTLRTSADSTCFASTGWAVGLGLGNNCLAVQAVGVFFFGGDLRHTESARLGVVRMREWSERKFLFCMKMSDYQWVREFVIGREGDSADNRRLICL